MKCKYCKKEYSTGRLLRDGTTLCDFCHDYEIALQVGAQYLETGNPLVFQRMKQEVESSNYL